MANRQKRKPKREALVTGVHLHSSVILFSLAIFATTRHRMMALKHGSGR